MMKVKLGDIAVLINGDRGKNYPSQADITCDGEVPFVNAGHLVNGEINFDDMNYISQEKFNSLNSGKFCKGDILYCLRGSLGKKAIVRENVNGAIASSLVIIRKKDELVDSEYLMFALDSASIKEQLIKANNGSSQPNLSATSVKLYELNLLDKKTQGEIVSRLLNVRKIINARKQQLQQLDELVKARFVELFGDLVFGDKYHGDKIKIGDIASVTKLAGFEFTKYIQYKEQGDIIMLRGLNCKKGHLILDDIKWIDKETSDLLPRSKLYYGDILMTYAGTIGDVAMVDADDKYHLAPNVAKITLNDMNKYNPIFLMHLFMYTNDYILTFAHTHTHTHTHLS